MSILRGLLATSNTKFTEKSRIKRTIIISFQHIGSRRTKSGVLIEFFRAMRICSPENLKEKCDHITDGFYRLRYPRAFNIECCNKAKRIKKKQDEKRNKRKAKERCSCSAQVTKL